MDIHKEIDTRGLNCPLPILKAKKALAEMVSGQLLKVVATDTGSLKDFQAFAKQTGNELVQQDTAGSELKGLHLQAFFTSKPVSATARCSGF
jgi:tRNA 2-thiouridine synthesizing protein A